MKTNSDPDELQTYLGLYAEMRRRREVWERASQDFSAAMRLVRELGPSSDGTFALETARRLHRKAFRQYLEAFEAHAAAARKLMEKTP